MLSDEISNWIKDKATERGARGAVVGLSGGVDSAVVAALVKKALGDNSLGLLLPCMGSSDEDNLYARMTAENFGLNTVELNLKEVYESYMNLFTKVEEEELRIEDYDRQVWPQTGVKAKNKEKIPVF